MVAETVKIHDKFSLEIKLGFSALRKQKATRFAMNTWVFMPRSLEINNTTFSKTDFYRGLKSNIRLITPVFNLSEITVSGETPFAHLERSFHELAATPTRTHIANYQYNIKMFLSILKSSLRNEINHIGKNLTPEDKVFLIERYSESVSKILVGYRNLRHIINVPTVTQDILKYYFFGDEFMSNLVEQHTYLLIRQIKKKGNEQDKDLWQSLLQLIEREVNYRKEKQYPVFEKENTSKNRKLLSRLGFLKKFAEGELYLDAQKRKEGVWIEQIYMSMAAGVSMIFATAIAFSMQQRYGNFTMPFFVALVVSYMLKDRIKELGRYYFAHKLVSRFFDQKINISLKGQLIGSEREAFDYISYEKVPEVVTKLRNKSAVFEDSNAQQHDSVILYRKMIKLNRENLNKLSNYDMPGINEIIRLNISNFLSKMDNPHIPIFVPDEEKGYAIIEGEKVYYLDMIMQLKKNEEAAYHYYRVTMNRKGILAVEKIGAL